MITLIRAPERQHQLQSNRETWHSFGSLDGEHALARGIGRLEGLTESRLPPTTTITETSRRSTAAVTYVQRGALDFEDCNGRLGVIQAGEFQHMVLVPGLDHSQTNASRKSPARVFRLWLCRVETDPAPDLDQQRFSKAMRGDRLCAVASPDGRQGSLSLHQDVLIYSALLAPGRRMVHELAAERSAWLHVVDGTLTFADTELNPGDGAGLTAERAISFTAREPSEILLVDTAQPPR